MMRLPLQASEGALCFGLSDIFELEEEDMRTRPFFCCVLLVAAGCCATKGNLGRPIRADEALECLWELRLGMTRSNVCRRLNARDIPFGESRSVGIGGRIEQSTLDISISEKWSANIYFSTTNLHLSDMEITGGLNPLVTYKRDWETERLMEEQGCWDTKVKPQ